MQQILADWVAPSTRWTIVDTDTRRTGELDVVKCENKLGFSLQVNNLATNISNFN